MVTQEDIWRELQTICDPEIPQLTITDMGIVADVQLDSQQGRVLVKITPTFVGCPATALICSEIEERLRRLPLREVRVEVTYDPPWNTNRLSERAREVLRRFGIAPPPLYEGPEFPLSLLQEPVECPYCGSMETQLRSPFGPTLCRAIYYCTACGQAFEQFKPV
ncbi:Putative 1,2-phenylacetyl-CoA epoxidase, subunit D [bacterium HR21]|jgi:ring-1,2-phenylacetyl-CoA epoxidase subunit PaaD|nr:Putative 1,2-phenylacetyl-CoA epoxidase, subunit D [bacterium HR21]